MSTADNISTEDEFKNLYPFASNFHEVGGQKLHYVDEGAGDEILVMVHGNPTWSFYYRRLIQAFKDTYRVIVPDHIGCGFSDKPQDYPYTLQTHIYNLDSLLATTGDKKVTLAVHDWGGAIGMGWAIRHPERVKKIVVFNTAAFLSQRIPFRINICRIPIFGALAIRGFNAFAGAAIHMAVQKPERLTPAIKAGFLKPYNNWANRIATLRFVQDIPLHDTHPSYQTLKTIDENLHLFADRPILIQWGKGDWCFDLSFYQSWLERFPQAERDLYEDASHYVIEDAHEKIIPRMQKFLQA
jgi:haloalkane dehalogenase